MGSILILFSSHFGQTRRIATALRDELRRDHDVELLDASLPDLPSPDAFDAVVVGSRVELGRHAADVRNYLAHHRIALLAKPTAFFSVSMAAASPGAGRDPSGYLEALFEELEWRPTTSVAFAGALPYRDYNWLLRFVMKRISRSAGHTTDTSRNHEFTDWPRVRAFAAEISALVKGAPHARRAGETQSVRD